MSKRPLPLFLLALAVLAILFFYCKSSTPSSVARFNRSDTAVVASPAPSTDPSVPMPSHASGVLIRVADRRERPVPGARIEFTSFMAPAPTSSPASTGPDGTFIAESLSEGTYIVTVSKPDFATEGVFLTVPAVSPVLVTLTPVGTVSGRVLDLSTGHPISSFTLEARAVSSGKDSIPKRGSPPKKYAGTPHGSFELPSLRPGHYVILVTGVPGHAHGHSRGFVIDEDNLIVTDLVIELSAGGSIQGRVVEKKSGDPLPNAEIRTRDNDWRPSTLSELFWDHLLTRVQSASTSTDTEGKFVLSNLMPGVYQLEIRTGVCGTRYVTSLGVEERQETTVERIEINCGTIVRGCVIDKGGSPVPRCRVWLRPIDGAGDGPALAGTTDEAGRFHYEGIQPGRYRVSASPEMQVEEYRRTGGDRREREGTAVVKVADEDVVELILRVGD